MFALRGSVTSQAVQRLSKLSELAFRELARVPDLVSNATELAAQRFALGGQIDKNTAFIIGIAATSDVSPAFQSLQKWRNSAGVHTQFCTQLAHCARRSVMQLQHHQILRKGETQRLQ